MGAGDRERMIFIRSRVLEMLRRDLDLAQRCLTLHNHGCAVGFAKFTGVEQKCYRLEKGGKYDISSHEV